MSRLSTLKAATSLHDVAYILGFKPKALAYVLYAKPAETKYRKFEIPKRLGGKRTISAPDADLKNLQKRLSKLLQDCISEINKTRKIQSSLSHGFRRGHSIVTNALPHRNRRYVLNLDLDNFFGTINFGRVRGFFIKNRNFELRPKVATILAQIACHENALPQGSPCSPVISNLIGHLLDIRLAALAHKTGCTYSRYADDLTFSTNKRTFPAKVGTPEMVPHKWKAGKEIKRIIRETGFTINAAKTRLQYQGSRQEVTGLVVNVRANPRAEYRRLARAMVHRLCKTGKFEIPMMSVDDKGNAVAKNVDGTLEQLQGILSFIDMVRAHKAKSDPRSPKSLDSYASDYRRFLFFKDFYSSTVPVIICEGKTDNIYIRSAIRRLAGSHPALAGNNATGSITLNVRIYRYSRHVGRILGVSGGTGDVVNFILAYVNECKTFAAPGMQQPVIILIDNDDGAKKVYSVVNNLNAGRQASREDPFSYVNRNLYVVPTPLTASGKATRIEDFFARSVRAIKLRGKKFNPSKKGFDNKTEYGKYLFAEQVVKKRESGISFGRFEPILATFEAVLKEHKKKVFVKRRATA
jgi:retron-type reverse transcriptase